MGSYNADKCLRKLVNETRENRGKREGQSLDSLSRAEMEGELKRP